MSEMRLRRCDELSVGDFIQHFGDELEVLRKAEPVNFGTRVFVEGPDGRRTRITYSPGTVVAVVNVMDRVTDDG